jgi:hypothetical protein
MHWELGTYGNSQGRIANAMKILKKGIEYCPTNHRLHHVDALWNMGHTSVTALHIQHWPFVPMNREMSKLVVIGCAKVSRKRGMTQSARMGGTVANGRT